MSSPAGRDRLCRATRVVVKIGSSLLAAADATRIEVLAAEARALRDRRVEVVFVSSGAIALGWRRLGYSERPRTLPALQAAAAVGQGELMHRWQRALDGHGLATAQVLLTHDDVRHRRRYLNARLALAELLRAGAVPVVNENDTVSVDEIKFGDNDRLAALCTSLVGADALVLLTDVAGLYAGDHTAGARLIPEVHDIDREAVAVAGGSHSGFGTGGMASKVEAARIAGRFGVVTVVASGRPPRPVCRLLDGATDCTVFWPSISRLQSRKHWIAYALAPAGHLVVDAGAKRALIEHKRSLLPSGVRAVLGTFEKGDAVSVVDEAGCEFARGLCAFASDEVVQVAGKRSPELAGALGYAPVEEVIHRDDLALL